jgi:hypothetical protein
MMNASAEAVWRLAMDIEYRVRPVVRYIVTRYYSNPDADDGLQSSGVRTIGEFDSPWKANTVCKALAASEDGAKCSLSEHAVAPDVN